jgi:hypothetical protein
MAHPYFAALHGVDIASARRAHPLSRPARNAGGRDGRPDRPQRQRQVHAGPGHCRRTARCGRPHRAPGPGPPVEQQTGPLHAASLAELAGLAAPLEALRRLAAGEAHDADFELVGERWDLEARWQAMLAQAGLDESMAPASLSGGQRTLLALIGAFCSDAELLVLDEPGNHLDRGHRAFLLEQMRAWRQSGRGICC